MKQPYAALAVAILAGCNVGVERDAPPGPEPGEFTRTQFAGLRWIEGDWRGRMPDGSFFYESYRFVDDSTIAMRSFADSALTHVSDSSLVRLRNRQIRNGAWVATRMGSDGIHFAAETNPANGFVWGPGPGRTWTATLRNGDAPAVVYRMEPHAGGACSPARSDCDGAPGSPGEVGLRFAALPEGYRSHVAYIIRPEAPVTHAAQVVDGPGGRRLWLSRATGSGPAGVTGWEVRAAAAVPREAAGEVLVAGSGCTFSGEPSAEIVAIAEARDAAWHGPVRHAWLLDPDAGAITPLPPAEVRCPNEAWGL